MHVSGDVFPFSFSRKTIAPGVQCSKITFQPGCWHQQGRLCEDEGVGEVPVSVGDFVSHLAGSEVM